MTLNFILRTFPVICTLAVLSTCQSPEKGKYKIFRYNQAEGLSSLDPAFARNLSNMQATSQMFNGLLELDDNLKPAPAIAKKMTVDSSGTLYTFTLRSDVYFHDHQLFTDGKGRKVVAGDFVYSFRRLMDPAVSSTGAWIFNDKILRDASNEPSPNCFEAPDDTTLVIRLQRPFPPFPELLTMNYAFVVPHEVTEHYGKDFRNHPVGTGPFTFKMWDEGNTLVMLRNNNYWKKDSAGRSLPYLDAVQVFQIKDKNMAFYRFRRGGLEVFSDLEEGKQNLVLDPYGNLKEEMTREYNSYKAPYMLTDYIGFRLHGPGEPKTITDSLKIRQALSLAINREDLILYLRNNLGRPGNAGMIPPALPSFNPGAGYGYSYNPEKAAALLAEAGYPQGKGLPVIKFYTNPSYVKIAEYLQKQWAKIGITVVPEVNQFSAHQEMADNGRIDFFRASWVGDYPDAENYTMLFYSKNFSPGGANKTHFHSEEYDRLFEKSMRETDPGRRNLLYTQLDSLAMSMCPVIVLFYDEAVFLTKKEVKNLKTNPLKTLNLECTDIIQ